MFFDAKLAVGFFGFVSESSPYVSSRKHEKFIHDFIKNMKENGIDNSFFQTAKKQWKLSHMIVGYESQWIATRLGSYEIIYGDYHKYNDYLKLIENITNEDIKRVVNQYFINDHKVVIQPKNISIIKKIGHFLFSPISKIFN